MTAAGVIVVGAATALSLFSQSQRIPLESKKKNAANVKREEKFFSLRNQNFQVFAYEMR